MFQRLDIPVFEKAIGRWNRQHDKGDSQVLAIDGKTLRGATGEPLTGVYLLAAYGHESDEVFGRLSVEAKTDEHKAALQLFKPNLVEG